MDSRYERAAVGTWIAIIVAFIAYGITIVTARIYSRQAPPQSVIYNPGADLLSLRQFPNVLICPNWDIGEEIGKVELEGIHCGWRSDQMDGRSPCEWETVPYLPLDKAPSFTGHSNNGYVFKGIVESKEGEICIMMQLTDLAECLVMLYHPDVSSIMGLS